MGAVIENKDGSNEYNWPNIDPISLLTVGSTPLYRFAIGVVVAQCLPVTESHVASSPSEAMGLPLWGRIGLLVIDLPSIGFDAAVLGRLIGRFQPRWSMGTIQNEDRNYLPMMRAANLDGYISTAHEVVRLKDAINCIVSGQKYFPEVAESKPLILEGAPRGGLSKRQIEVLALIAQGKSNSEIARILEISRGTVNVHAHAILKLVGANNRTSAAMIYRDQYASSY